MSDAQPEVVTALFEESARPARRRHAVFISDFVHLSRPFDEMASKLLDPEGEWLKTAALSAAWQRFTLTAGEARPSGSSVIVPITWEPRSFDRLLPMLDGDIELSGLGDGHCRLAVSGRYGVPLHHVGFAMDRLAMHRVAETAVRRFLRDLAETLEAT
jgi:hypothetical protein